MCATNWSLATFADIVADVTDAVETDVCNILFSAPSCSEIASIIARSLPLSEDDLPATTKGKRKYMS